MRAWLKGGLIGAGIAFCIMVVLFAFIIYLQAGSEGNFDTSSLEKIMSPLAFYCKYLEIEPQIQTLEPGQPRDIPTSEKTTGSQVCGIISLSFWLVIGFILGIIVGKLKQRKQKQGV